MRLKRTAIMTGALIITTALFGFNTLQAEEVITIGQADMERVFNEYQETKDFQAEIPAIQQEFHEAQQAGDQQKLMEIQQNFQVKQGELIQNFQNALEKASGPVSEKANVHIIVAEVLYHSDSARIVDVSDELIEEMNL